MINTEFGTNTGIVMEGWLEKKSRRSGFWVKRYYVLNESSRDFCVLRAYGKCVETSWGVVPIQLKNQYPLTSISSITTNSNRNAKGTEFSIVIEVPRKTSISTDLFASSSSPMRTSSASLTSARSEDGDSTIGEVSHILQLRAPDAQSRMIWVMMIEKLYECMHHGEHILYQDDEAVGEGNDVAAGYDPYNHTMNYSDTYEGGEEVYPYQEGDEEDDNIYMNSSRYRTHIIERNNKN